MALDFDGNFFDYIFSLAPESFASVLHYLVFFCFCWCSSCSWASVYLADDSQYSRTNTQANQKSNKKKKQSESKKMLFVISSFYYVRRSWKSPSHYKDTSNIHIAKCYCRHPVQEFIETLINLRCGMEISPNGRNDSKLLDALLYIGIFCLLMLNVAVHKMTYQTENGPFS